MQVRASRPAPGRESLSCLPAHLLFDSSGFLSLQFWVVESLHLKAGKKGFTTASFLKWLFWVGVFLGPLCYQVWAETGIPQVDTVKGVGVILSMQLPAIGNYVYIQVCWQGLLGGWEMDGIICAGSLQVLEVKVHAWSKRGLRGACLKHGQGEDLNHSLVMFKLHHLAHLKTLPSLRLVFGFLLSILDNLSSCFFFSA